MSQKLSLPTRADRLHLADRYEVNRISNSQEGLLEESQGQNRSRYQEQYSVDPEGAAGVCDPGTSMRKNSYKDEIRGAVEARPKGSRQPGRPLEAKPTPVTSALSSSSPYTDHLPSWTQLSTPTSSSQRHESKYDVAGSSTATNQSRPIRPGLVQIEEYSEEEDSEESTPVPGYESCGSEIFASPKTSLRAPPGTETSNMHNVNADASSSYSKANGLLESSTSSSSSSALGLPYRSPEPYSYVFSRSAYSYIPQKRAPSPPTTPHRTATDSTEILERGVRSGKSSSLLDDSPVMKGRSNSEKSAGVSVPNTFWTPPASDAVPKMRVRPNSSAKDGTSGSVNTSSSRPSQSDRHRSPRLQTQPRTYYTARGRSPKRAQGPPISNFSTSFDGGKARADGDVESLSDPVPAYNSNRRERSKPSSSSKFDYENSSVMTPPSASSELSSVSNTSSQIPHPCPDGHRDRKSSVKRSTPVSQSHSQTSSRSSSPESYLPSAESLSTPPTIPIIPASESAGALSGSGSITAITFSPDGKYFASGSKDSNILVWDVNSETPNGRSLTYHKTEITCMAFSPNSATLASSSYDSRVYTCDLKSEMRNRSCFEVGAPVTSIAYSPSGQNLICGYRSGKVQTWNVNMHSIPLRAYEGHSDAVTFVIYSPNRRLIASASDDLAIKIWGVLSDHKPVATIRLREKVAIVSFTANNDHIVSASFGGSVCVWSISAGLLISRLILEGSRPFRCFDFSADGKYLASGSSDQAVRIHTIKTGRVISGPHFGHESQIEAIAISSDSKLVVSGGHDGSLRRWKIDVSETEGNGDILSGQMDAFRDNRSDVEILDDLWARLKPLSAHESVTQQLEMRDWSNYIARGTFIDGGACGDVYAGTWVNVPGLTALAPPDVVLKIMRPNIRNALDQDRKVRRELEVWMKLRHPNILSFIGVAYDLVERSGSTTCPIMISLRMANGDLKRYLSQNQTCDREAFPLQIARGLAYLHHFDPEIVHGDLKAKNVFVDGDGTLKLGDFGLSRMLSDESLWVTTAKTAGGTVRWMSPELLESQPTVTKESDVYAFAMTVFEIFSNQVPFAHYLNDARVLTAVLLKKERPSRPHAIKDWIWDIMEDCWSFEPSQRLKIEKIIERLGSGPPK